MEIVCLDLEGVLVPEIWIAFAEETGIPELKRTTRDEPDYDKLMKYRLNILKEHNVKSALLNLGGNVHALGSKPDGTPWKIAIKNPLTNSNAAVISIVNKAVITSGAYERYFIDDNGVKYGHIIDPNTGMPINNELLSVSIIGKDAVLCDALSTSLFVMGLEKSIEYWKKNNDFDAVFITKEIKTKTIQKYYINKLDIIAVIIILGLAITIVIMNYGTNIAVKHAVTDAATHYFASDDFYRYSTLFSRESSDTIKWLNTPYLMTGAYVNTGIFLKLFKGIIDETFLVKLYFIFDMFIWMLSGLLMYTALSTNFKNKKHQILALVLTIFYMLAYQLNSLFAGFSYLGVGLDIIIGIIIIMKSEIKTNYKISSLFLLNLGIMFSYYYFAPVLFLAELWYILATNKKQNIKIFSKQNIFEILIALVIPGLIGVIYFIGYPLMQANNKAFDYVGAIATDGFIYEDLIMNIFPYLLLSEVYIIYIAFKKKNTFIDKLLYLTVIFTLLIYMLMKLEFVSSYYYYKIYYMLFLVLTVSSYEILKIFVDKGKNVTIIVSGVLIIYSFGIFSAMILDKNWFVFDIYLTNGEEIKDDYALIKDKEFYLFEYYNNNINTMQNDDTLFCKTKGNTGRDRWVYSITKNGNNLTNALTNDKITTVEKFMENSKYHYFVLLKNDYGGEYDKVQDEVKRYNLKILIQNSAGMILEKQDLAE